MAPPHAPRVLLGISLCLLAARPARADELLLAGPSLTSSPALPAPPAPPVVSSLSNGRALVSQAGMQWSIAPFDGRTDIVSFYSYGVPVNSCANTGLETQTVSLLFLYQDTTQIPAPLSLVCINDLPNNVAGGQATFSFSGLPAASNWAVQDDDYDTYVNFPPVNGQTQAQWSWSTCCTDGGAIDGLETEPFCVIVDADFLAGIRQWQLLDGPDLATPVRNTLPSMTDAVYICGDCLTFTCPAPIVAECDGTSTRHVTVLAQGGSLCGGEVITNDRTAGGADASDDYPLGTTDVHFELVDAGGFTTSCTTSVTVQHSLPPIIDVCPSELVLDCTGTGDVPVSDPRIQAWLATFQASDACGPVTISNDAPASFPSGCLGSRTDITFRAVDSLGLEVSCVATVVAHSQCITLPADVGPALRVRDHGDPHAADITAVLDWALDFGAPRPPDQHYHVLRGTSPQLLSPIPGTEPFAATASNDSTPAATSLPLVHYYSVLAAGPCEDQSLD